MRKINWRSIILGGLMAGFVANLLQFVANRLYLRAEWEAAGAVWSKADNAFASHLPLATLTFAGGIIAVFLYAIMRMWLGSGPKTAAVAELTFWAFEWLYPVMLWSLQTGGWR